MNLQQMLAEKLSVVRSDTIPATPLLPSFGWYLDLSYWSSSWLPAWEVCLRDEAPTRLPWHTWQTQGPAQDMTPILGLPVSFKEVACITSRALGILCKGLRVDFDAVFDTVVVQVPSGVGYGLALWLEVGPK